MLKVYSFIQASELFHTNSRNLSSTSPDGCGPTPHPSGGPTRGDDIWTADNTPHCIVNCIKPADSGNYILQPY